MITIALKNFIDQFEQIIEELINGEDYEEILSQYVSINTYEGTSTSINSRNSLDMELRERSCLLTFDKNCHTWG